MPSRPEVVRLVGTNRALTAQVFEENFRFALGGSLSLRTASVPMDLKENPAFFDAGDFFAPNYEIQPLVPWLLARREALGKAQRLLFVAHAPGGMAWVWRLLAPLLRPGDRIVAPSPHAASVIVWLEPSLEPFVRVIGHPIPGPTGDGLPGEPAFLYLGRIRPEKCLHQLIDGYALFRSRRPGPPLVIAGPLHDDDDGRPLSYVTALRRRAARLGLESSVLFPGPLRGRMKEEALAGALGLCNLSLSLEESFGKAPAEGLVRGLPVLATTWSAFPEMLRSRGVFVPCRKGAGSRTVDAGEIASGLEALLDLGRLDPLRDEANPYAPRAVGGAYEKLLTEALDESSLRAPSGHLGALDRVAPLGGLSWEELFGFHRDECSRRLKRMAGNEAAAYGQAERIQGILALSLQEDLTALFARDGVVFSGQNLSLPLDGTESPLFRGAARGEASLASRLASVAALAEEGEVAEARRLLEALPEGGGALRAFAAVRLALKEGDAGGALRAWAARPGAWSEKEEGGAWLRMGAEIARFGGSPAARAVLPVLKDWCRRFPDGPETGAVALGWCLAALAGDVPEEGREALNLARALLPEGELLRRLDSVLLGVC